MAEPFVQLPLPCTHFTLFYPFMFYVQIISYCFSWYSWTIQSMVNGVYAFGFLFMLPQLFINYRLKSVAHLPWRAFMYKVSQQRPFLCAIVYSSSHCHKGLKFVVSLENDRLLILSLTIYLRSS